jgi:hypothetical protein
VRFFQPAPQAGQAGNKAVVGEKAATGNKAGHFVIPSNARNLSSLETQENGDSPACSAPRNDKNSNLIANSTACPTGHDIVTPSALRRELETAGCFALADPAAVSPESSDVETLRRLIATQPGLSQKELLDRAGLPDRRVLSLLRSQEERIWKMERGHHGAMRYYPLRSEDQDPDAPGAALQLCIP